MSVEGDVAFVQRNLVKTVDRATLIDTLKLWRKETSSKDEATILTDLITEVMSGSMDG